MDATDIITILAIFLGPIFAVQIQKILDRTKEMRSRKFKIFYTLMSTRAIRSSQEHVLALNMIDIEFYGNFLFGKRRQSKSEKQVTDAWKIYKDYLNNGLSPIDSSDDKATDMFTLLLERMGKDIGYEFDKVQIQRDFYRPVAQQNIENSQYKILADLEKVLEGKKAIPICFSEIKEKNNP